MKKAFVVMHHEAGEVFVMGVFSTAEKAAAVKAEDSRARYVVAFNVDQVLDLDAAVSNDVDSQFSFA